MITTDVGIDGDVYTLQVCSILLFATKWTCRKCQTSNPFMLFNKMAAVHGKLA